MRENVNRENQIKEVQIRT